MTTNDEKQRVLIAITDTAPLPEIWRATVAHLSGSSAQLVALIVTDDRWHRAASLSFTREISRLGGYSADFTPRRAQQVDRESITQLQRQVRKLAAEADLPLVLETLSEHDSARIEKLVGAETSVLIASSTITTRPIYAELIRLNCQVQLIDSLEPTAVPG